MKRSQIVLTIIFLVLLLDQGLKIWIKTHYSYGQEVLLFGLNWARLHFVENEGMAFGWKYGGDFGKLMLSLFRIVAVGVLIVIVRQMIIKKEPKGLIICFSLILAGAIGNIIDSAFYGLLFTESTFGQVAQWAPTLDAHRGFLFGKVVDMFYFPLFDFVLPDWIPLRGGTRFQFFKPVFNLADSSIFIGVTSILLFYRAYFFGKNTTDKKPDTYIQPSRISSGD